jgi:hypothetical protein
MTASPDEATADPSVRCEEARRLAEHGDLGRAAAIFEEVLALGDTPCRAMAALGLAVVREDEGDHAAARAADEIAIATGDHEYAPRAAYHLALSHERDGDLSRAKAAWERVVGFDNAAYLPPACLALAQIADDEQDFATARQWWERTISSAAEPYAATAAHDLAQRLLEDGEAAAAQRILDHARAGGAGDARLAVSLGIAHLDLAIAALREAAGAEDPEVTPLAVELLARVLPLRGRERDGQRVWRHGLDSPDGRIAEGVRARIRRDLDSSGITVWWDEAIEASVTTNTLPSLTDAVFAALDQMYVLVAMRYAESPEDLPDDVEALLGDAVRVPSEYPWGRALHASFAERLRAAMGADEDVLPPHWPDTGEPGDD